MNKFIEFKNVTYTAESLDDKPRHILKDINFEIKQGEFISIIGSNGCGKSTLLKLLCGLERQTQGEVRVNFLSNDLSDNLYEIRKNVGMVFQNPDDQIITSTVEEEIAFGMENLCIPPQEMHYRIKESLEAVGMIELKDKAISCLSGGQKQRLNIASILAMKPKIFILDEPTSMIDSQSRNKIMNFLLEINRTNKITIILVTHFAEEVLLSDRVILMDNGKIKSDTSPISILSNEEFLKNPCIAPLQSTEILSYIKHLGYNVSLRALSTQDCATEITELLERYINA